MEREEDEAARLGYSTRDSNNTVSWCTLRDPDGNQKRCLVHRTANAELAPISKNRAEEIAQVPQLIPERLSA